MKHAMHDRLPERMPEPPPQVLIVVRDESVREILRLLLADAGYTAATCPDGNFARKLLQAARHPRVVLLTHGGSDQSWGEVLSVAPTLPAHRYLLLSTQRPEQVPTVWNPHTQAAVPVLLMPFEVEALIAQVAEAVSQLDSLPDQP